MLQPTPELFRNPATEAQALYIHVPFCFHKCHYCDFYSIVETGSDRQEQFTARLIAELKYRAKQLRLLPRTLFVGGGTPTLLRPDLWRRLLAALRETVDLGGVEEFTVEANPETVTPELADILVAGGVNRVSIGAQSFDLKLLKALERWHEPASIARAVEVFRGAGIGNINLDLIFAIPGQTLETLVADLEAVLALGPTHMSCYGLTYEPNTAMTQRLKLGQITPTEEDLERQMYELVIDKLDTAGFEHYEVSNWAKKKSRVPSPGSRDEEPETRDPRLETHSSRCRHNLAYWNNLNWLGVGPAAASHADGRRWKNAPHLGKYLEQEPEPPVVDFEELPPERRAGEELMLRLRMREGIALPRLNQILPDTDPRHKLIGELIQLGFLERTPTHLRLTRRGLMVADSIIARLL